MVGRDMLRLVGDDVPLGQRRRDRFGERFAGDALVPHAQPALVPGKADAVARPVMAHERRDEPAILLCDVAVEKGPDVIAADRSRFDQPHVEVGPLRRERERRKAAGEPAADDRDVASIDVLPRHPSALATRTRGRKAIATRRRAASLAP